MHEQRHGEEACVLSTQSSVAAYIDQVRPVLVDQRAECQPILEGHVEVFDLDVFVPLCFLLAPEQQTLLCSLLFLTDVFDGELGYQNPDHAEDGRAVALVVVLFLAHNLLGTDLQLDSDVLAELVDQIHRYV